MLTDHQKSLVKATVPVLRENGVALTDYFYKRMLDNSPELKETFNMGNQRSGAQAKALAGAVLAYAEHIDDPSVLMPVVELVCNKHVSLNVQAPDYAVVGENLLHSISEVLNIAMEDELISAWGAAYGQLAEIFIETEHKIYAEHQATHGSWLGWREFTIDEKKIETDEVISFYLKPVDNKPLPDYKPGQYITVRVYVPELGYKQPRQYSISSSPGENYLRISVKREDPKEATQDPGYVSSTLHNHLSQGSVIEVSAPVGNFFLCNPEKNNVLISGGIGLTPMVAMLNQLITKNSEPFSFNSIWKSLTAKRIAHEKQITFIHAARSSASHALKEEVNSLAKSHDNVNIFIAYGEKKNDEVLGRDFDMEGRLDLTKVPAQILPSDADYYLCGPIPFMQEQYDALVKLGIAKAQIHMEAFGTGGVAV